MLNARQKDAERAFKYYFKKTSYYDTMFRYYNELEARDD